MDRQDEVIRSRTNSILKRARGVGRGKEPGFILLEGERLVRDAVQAGHRPEVLVVSEAKARGAADLVQRYDVRVCADGLLDGLGSVKTSSGIAGVFREPACDSLDPILGDLGPQGAALVLGVAGVSDPGNLGALFRVAEAAGVVAAVVAPGGARPFGPKALRGSMGSLLRVPVLQPAGLAQALAELSAAGFEHFVASTRGGTSMETAAFAPRSVLWMTSETGEIPAELRSSSGVTIPMGGGVESLNVTVAGALLLYAARTRVLGERPE